MFLGVGILAAGIILGRRDLIFVAGVLTLIPLVALVYITARPAQTSVSRTFLPPIVPTGNNAVVSLQVRNLSPRTLAGATWRDSASPGLPTPPAAPLPGLTRYTGGSHPGGARGDTTRIDYVVTPRLRGVYATGPLLLGRFDPFLLAYSESPVGEPHDLVVTPRVTALPGTGMSVMSGDGSLHELLRHMNPNSDELIAREYRQGDPLRRVNWRATARRGEIMVRQEEQRSNPEARIILDTTLSGHPDSLHTDSDRAPRHFQAFELAVEMVASVGVHLLESGFRLQVAELGASQLAPGGDRVRGGLRGDAPVFFRAPGGDHNLLEGLANIVPVTAIAPGETLAAPTTTAIAAGRQTPTFAVLVDIDAGEAAELATLRNHSDPAVAFTLETMDRAVIDTLSDAGWHCIAVRTVTGIAAAWEAVAQDRGAVRDSL